MTRRYAVVVSKLVQQRFDDIICADRKLGVQIAKAIDRLAANPQLGESSKDNGKATASIARGGTALFTVLNTNA